MLKKESFFQYLFIQSVNYSNNKFVNFLPKRNTSSEIAKLFQQNILKLNKKKTNSEAICQKVKLPSYTMATNHSRYTPVIPLELQQDFFVATKSLKNTLKLKTGNSNTVFLLFRKIPNYNKAITLEAMTLQKVKTPLWGTVRNFASKKLNFLVKKNTKTNEEPPYDYKDTLNKKIKKLKEIFLNKQNFLSKIAFSKTKKYSIMNFNNNKLFTQSVLLDSIIMATPHNTQSDSEIYRPYKKITMKNKRKTNLVSNIFLTYKKSFLCYWLLPLIGLISLTKLSITPNLQTQNFIFLRQIENQKDLKKKQSTTIYDENWSPEALAKSLKFRSIFRDPDKNNKTVLLDTVHPAIFLTKKEIPQFYTLKSNIFDHQSTNIFKIFMESKCQGASPSSKILSQVKLPVKHIAYSAYWPLIRPEYSISLHSKTNKAYPFGFSRYKTINIPELLEEPQKNFLKFFKKIFYYNLLVVKPQTSQLCWASHKQDTNFSQNASLKKLSSRNTGLWEDKVPLLCEASRGAGLTHQTIRDNSPFKINFAKLNFTILKDKIKKHAKFNFIWYEFTVTSNNEKNLHIPNKIVAPMQKLIIKDQSKQCLEVKPHIISEKFDKSYRGETSYNNHNNNNKECAPLVPCNIQLNNAIIHDNSHLILSSKEKIQQKFFENHQNNSKDINIPGIKAKMHVSKPLLEPNKEINQITNILREILFASNKITNQSTHTYKYLIFKPMSQLWEETTTKNFIGIISLQNKLKKSFFNANPHIIEKLPKIDIEKIIPAKSFKKASYLLDHLLINNNEKQSLKSQAMPVKLNFMDSYLASSQLKQSTGKICFKELLQLNIFKNILPVFFKKKSLLSKNAKKLTETIILLLQNNISQENKFIRNHSTTNSKQVASRIYYQASKTLNNRDTLYNLIFQGLKIDFDKLIANLTFSKKDNYHFNNFKKSFAFLKKSPTVTPILYNKILLKEASVHKIKKSEPNSHLVKIIKSSKANQFFKLNSSIIGGNLKTKLLFSTLSSYPNSWHRKIVSYKKLASKPASIQEALNKKQIFPLLKPLTTELALIPQEVGAYHITEPYLLQQRDWAGNVKKATGGLSLRDNPLPTKLLRTYSFFSRTFPKGYKACPLQTKRMTLKTFDTNLLNKIDLIMNYIPINTPSRIIKDRGTSIKGRGRTSNLYRYAKKLGQVKTNPLQSLSKINTQTTIKKNKTKNFYLTNKIELNLFTLFSRYLKSITNKIKHELNPYPTDISKNIIPNQKNELSPLFLPGLYNNKIGQAIGSTYNPTSQKSFVTLLYGDRWRGPASLSLKNLENLKPTEGLISYKNSYLGHEAFFDYNKLKHPTKKILKTYARPVKHLFWGHRPQNNIKKKKIYARGAKLLLVKNSKIEKIFISYLSQSKKGSYLNLPSFQKQYTKKAQIESIFSILKKPIQNKLLIKEQKNIGQQTAKLSYKIKNKPIYPKNYANLPKKSFILLLKNRLFINKKQNNELWGDLEMNTKSTCWGDSPPSNTIKNQKLIQENRRKKQQLKLKRRLKKMQCATRRRKKRKIFYPRPNWVTLTLYDRFLKYRFLSKKNVNCETSKTSYAGDLISQQNLYNNAYNKILDTCRGPLEEQSPPKTDKYNKGASVPYKSSGITPTIIMSKEEVLLGRLYEKHNNANSYLTSKNYLNLTKLNLYKSNFFSEKYCNWNKIIRSEDSYKNVSYYKTIPLAKDFYSISPMVFRDLRRILMKSNWLRNYLNQYFDKIQTIYKEIERDSKKLDIFFKIRSLILSFYGSSLSSTKIDQYFDTSCKNPINNSSLREPYKKWGKVLVFEYNRLIYQRIQRLILNIRENLNLNGQLKNRSQKLGKNIRPFIKRDYLKRDSNIVGNQNENILVKSFKKNIFNLSCHFVLLNKGYEDSMPYIRENLTPLVQNNLYWTWNKTENIFTLNNSNNSSYSKKLWEKYKIREINKNNKTKKIIFNLFMKYNNILNDKNIINADSIYKDLCFIRKEQSQQQSIPAFKNKDIVEKHDERNSVNAEGDKKNLSINKINQWQSKNFFCEEKQNYFDQIQNVIYKKQKNSFLVTPIITDKANLSNFTQSNQQKENIGNLINSPTTTKLVVNFSEASSPPLRGGEESHESQSKMKSVAIKNYIDKSEKKFINIEKKLILLGFDSNRSIQPSFIVKSQNKRSQLISYESKVYLNLNKSQKHTQFPLNNENTKTLVLDSTNKNKIASQKNKYYMSKKRLHTKKFYGLLSERQQLRKQLIIPGRTYNYLGKVALNKIVRISTLGFKKNYFRFLKQELLKKKSFFYRKILEPKNSNAESKVTSTNQKYIQKIQQLYYTIKQKTFKNISGIKISSKIQNYNKFSNTTYWWTKLNMDNLTNNKLTQKKLQQKTISKKSIVATTYYLTLISFLFHFCTLLSFISFGGIRTVLKFYYILFSKISKIINQIRFTKLLPESPQKSSFTYTSKNLLQKKNYGLKPLTVIPLRSGLLYWGDHEGRTPYKIEHVLFLFKSLKVLFVKSLFSKNNPQSFSKTRLVLGYFDKKKGINNKYSNSLTDNQTPDNVSHIKNLSNKASSAGQHPVGPVFDTKEKISNFLILRTKKAPLQIVNGVNFFLRSYIKSLNKSELHFSSTEDNTKIETISAYDKKLEKNKPFKVRPANMVKLFNNLIRLGGFAPRQLFYKLNIKAVLGLNFIYKISFYSYLLVLKSVDILVAPAFWIYKFFEKPGEYVVENLAYSFLLEWSADLVTTIPDSIDTFFSIYFNKVNGNMPLYLFLLGASHQANQQNWTNSPKLISNSSRINGTKYSWNSKDFALGAKPTAFSVLLESIYSLFLFGINSSILKRFTNSSLLLFIQQLSEPDFDYINRRKKGIIFWDLWGEGLKTIAEKNSVNIYELSTDKEEQLKLLSNMQNYSNKVTQDSTSVSLTQSSSDTFATSNIGSNLTQYNKGLPLIIWRAKLDTSQAQPDRLKKIETFFKADLTKRKKKLTKNSTVQKFFKNINVLSSKSQNTTNPLTASRTVLLDRWSVNQFLNYHGKDTDLFIDLHPPRTFSTAANSLKYSFSIQAPIGSIVCQIFGGIFYKQISKNILVVLPKSSQTNKYQGGSPEKSLLIQAIAGETELKIITDNAYRYAMVVQGVAVGIKLLKDVFEALCATGPCIFLIEDIHAIGERRPFLIDEASPNLTESIYNKNKSMQSFLLKEKSNTSRETLYRTNKHLLTNYKKPYKEVKRLSSNHFSFTFLYHAANYTKIRTSNLNPSEIPLSIQVSQKEIGILGESKTIDTYNPSQENNNHNSFSKLLDEKDFKIYTDSTLLKRENKKNIYSSFSLLIKSIKNKQSLINTPSSSPFSLLLMKEATKLKPNQSVKEMSWFGLPGESYSLISKYNYSIRIKVALLADSILSNLSNKLEMITDLLVIIDSVKGNRGFIIFATTHLPDILDPALRRPGRFDETISLPYIPALYSRWTNYRYNLQNLTSSFFKHYTGHNSTFNCNFNKGSTVDFSKYSFSYNDSQFDALFPIYSSMSSFGRLCWWRNQRCNPILNKIPARIKSHPTLLIRGEKKGYSPLNQVLDVPLINQPLANSNTISHFLFYFLNKNLPIFYSRATAYASNTLISLMLYSSKEKDLKNRDYNVSLVYKNTINNKQLSETNSIALTEQLLRAKHEALSPRVTLQWPSMLKESKINNQFLENYSTYLSLFGPSYFNKMNFGQIIFISFIANKIGETFGLSSNYKKQYSLRSTKNRKIINYVDKNFATKFKDIRKESSQLKNVNSFLFNFHQKSDWKNGPSLLYSYIQKRFPHLQEKNNSINSNAHGDNLDLSTQLFPYSVQQQKTKLALNSKAIGGNLITFYSNQLLNFNNKYSLMEPPSPPISNILLPAKRYEHYKRSFKNFYDLNIETEKTSETIKKHQQQRLLKRLYNYPIKEFFRNEKISLFRDFHNYPNNKLVLVTKSPNNSNKIQQNSTNIKNNAGSFFDKKSGLSEAQIMSPKPISSILGLKNKQAFIKPQKTTHKNNFVNFTQSYFILSGIESFVPKKLASLNSFYSFNSSYRNILYSRHKTYLINQWWNGQQGEHNLESTFFSDIDWRYTQIQKNKKINNISPSNISQHRTLALNSKTIPGQNPPLKSSMLGLGGKKHRFFNTSARSASQQPNNNDIHVDFPDCEHFYNPRNRRWILTKGDWNYWFNIEANLNNIYSHYIYESFSKVYKSIDSNREFLDFYSSFLLKSSFNFQKITEKASKQNISFTDLDQKDILNLYKRFFFSQESP